ncbi:B3 domain-containing protein [Senna tora]|uniref:B3 domain-containing protein n=1 Tax=Senna tora TaxID=362788 RepID=A0A834TW73_9FABA|nr:B3 domain-containing protein [Senna tora]
MACQDCEDNFNVRRPHFYELYSSTSSSVRLKIPAGFICHMEGRTPGSVSLTGPSGNTWHVQLIKQDDDLFLHHGWPTFLEDHSIESGDLLVFRYEGHFHFTVLVFDQRACEKEAAFNSECRQTYRDLNYIKAQKRDREEDSLNVVAEGLLKKIRGSSVKNQELNMSSVDKELSLLEGVKPISMFREKGESSNKNEQVRYSASDIAVPSQKEYSKDEEAAMQIGSGKEDDQYMHSRICLSKLSPHDEKRVAQLFTSSFPFFVRIMKSFNISGSYTLNIPYQFSMAHLPNCKIKIVLHNIKGERWTVNSVPTTRVHTSHTLCGGWMAFVRGNNINIGDICIFELVHECELRVSIVGAGRDEIDCQVGKLAFSRSLAGHSINSHKTSRYMPINAKVNSKCLAKVDLSDKKWSKMGQDAMSIDKKKPGRPSMTSTKMGICSQTKASLNKLGVQRRHRTEDELSSQAKAGLRMLFALDEQRVAQAFTSSFPNFVKIMKKFNVSGSYTLKIPYQFSAAHLPSYKTEVLLRNIRGECWTVNCVPDTKGRAVHTFCGGWMAFVRDNDINFGDTCIFELVAKCEMQALPRTFSDNLRTKLPDCVTLKGPSGAIWSIGLTTRDDTLYFTHGWQQFVKDHCLEENDLLVFKYNNESQFEVLIFDREGFCEKAGSYFVRKCEHTNKRNRDDCREEVNIPNGRADCASPEKFKQGDSIRVPAVVPSETSSKETFNAGAEFVSPVSVAVPTRRVKARGSKSNARGGVNWIIDAETPSAGKSKTNDTVYTSNRRPVTEEEKNITLQLAQEACTSDGFFIVMRPTHVYKRFYASIPSKWITEHLSPYSEDVILRVGEREWPAKFSFEHGRRTGGLTGGWKHFALDNNLEEFDVCVIRLADKTIKPMVMEVQIFRVVEEVTALSGGKQGRKAIQA